MLLHKQSRFVMCAAVLCLSFTLVSCAKTTPPTDPKAEFVGSLKDADLTGFYYETLDTDAQDVAAMTNPAIHEPIKMDGDATVVLRYARVHDKKANTTTTYKAEAVRSGDKITVQVTDIASGASAMQQTGEFPAPPAAAAAGGCGDNFPAFTSFDDCTCTLRAALLVEANRTCTPQGAAVTCCVNGNLFSVHLSVQPTRFLCQIGPLENITDLVFFRD